MDFMEGLMDEVNGAVSGATNQTQQSIYACEACLKGYKTEEAVEVCPICGATARQWVGKDIDEALARATRSKNLQTKAATPEPTPAPITPEVDERQPLWDTLEGMGIQFSKRMKSDTLQKLLDAAMKPPTAEKVIADNKPAKVEEPKVIEPEIIEDDEPEAPTSLDKIDHKELRKQATLKFIDKYKLNEISPVKVGTAEVQLIGFTMWADKKPAFRFMQSFETPQMFQTEYNKARAEQPSCAIDVVQCNNNSNPELKACLYNGNLVVSLNNGNGTTAARAGELVEVGALKTSTNHIRFVALKVIRN